jgi:hypothetical protein
MTLPTHARGRSGLQITRLGFGSWAAGGGGWAFGWGPQDDGASLGTMRHALDLGVNWIDTAAVYGLGHSEEVVGRLLREIPDAQRPYIFTKCGLMWKQRSHARTAANPGPRFDSPRVRGVASAARDRAHRPLSVSLAGRERHAYRGLMGRDAEAGAGRKSPRNRRVEFRCPPAVTLRGDRPRRFAATAVLINQSRGRGLDPMVREPQAPA